MKIEEKVEALKNCYKDLKIASFSSCKRDYWIIYSYYTIGKPNLPKITAYSFEELIDKAYKKMSE